MLPCSVKYLEPPGSSFRPVPVRSRDGRHFERGPELDRMVGNLLKAFWRRLISAIQRAGTTARGAAAGFWKVWRLNGERVPISHCEELVGVRKITGSHRHPHGVPRAGQPPRVFSSSTPHFLHCGPAYLSMCLRAPNPLYPCFTLILRETWDHKGVEHKLRAQHSIYILKDRFKHWDFISLRKE